MRELKVDELYFSAAHYIPEHPTCGVLHGHTYFVKDLSILVRGFVDLEDIKKAVAKFDHCTFVPSEHKEAWDMLRTIVNIRPEFEKLQKVFSNVRYMLGDDIPGTTVEMIAEELRQELRSISGVAEVHFFLTEGPIAGRIL